MKKALIQDDINLVRTVLFGPESTGKTTLAIQLAKHYNTVWVEEYARQYLKKVQRIYDYSDLKKVVGKRVKAIICLGLNNMKIMDQFENMVEYIIDTKSMDEAVSAAYKISSSGDCVLLSPACASFDLFDDFEDRGRQFKASVRKL